MSYRCLMIVNPARIRCKNEQLLIETEEVHSVPIEDISAIVLESRQSTITTAAMAALAQNGVVTFWSMKHICRAASRCRLHSTAVSWEYCVGRWN